MGQAQAQSGGGPALLPLLVMAVGWETRGRFLHLSALHWPHPVHDQLQVCPAMHSILSKDPLGVAILEVVLVHWFGVASLSNPLGLPLLHPHPHNRPPVMGLNREGPGVGGECGTGLT